LAKSWLGGDDEHVWAAKNDRTQVQEVLDDTGDKRDFFFLFAGRRKQEFVRFAISMFKLKGHDRVGVKDRLIFCAYCEQIERANFHNHKSLRQASKAHPSRDALDRTPRHTCPGKTSKSAFQG